MNASLGAKAIALLGTWARPPDLPSKLALGLALVLLVVALAGRGRALLFPGGGLDAERVKVERRWAIGLGALAAALLSIAYVSRYLAGGPRIVDATSYFLQGRALAHGDLAWTPLAPTGSFRGRFLLSTSGDLGGIFPPGYPLLLALGFLLGSPMLVGPLLAAGLVAATHRLARRLAAGVAPDALVEPIARAAALLSIVSAALRYHTADTMSHGATALAIAIALERALAGAPVLSGVALGFVVAARPVSALPIGLVVACLLARGERRRLGLLALGAIPGLLLLLASQRAVTGSWLTSTQLAYYAASDGPPSCFRYGFGAGIGCLHEHGQYVKDRLEGGYGALAAIGTTLRRLRLHLLDVANLEPLALLVLVPLAKRRTRAVVAASALVGLHFLAYAPFYFDGDYPGGGGRFFADVLPVEHALVALAIAELARLDEGRFVRAALGTVALALAGFAIHAVHEHLLLRDREGGRPFFEPEVLTRLHVERGLVFLDTDHGFALAHDPSVKSAAEGVVVARLRGDAHDRVLHEALGRPPAWHYLFEPLAGGRASATLAPWKPPEADTPYRFEAEAEWPALDQAGGYAIPVFTHGCASRARVLALVPEPRAGRATTTIALPVPAAGRWVVEIHVAGGVEVPFAAAGPDGEGALAIGEGRWTWAPTGPCAALPAREIELAPPEAKVTLEARGGAVALDAIVLRPSSPP